MEDDMGSKVITITKEVIEQEFDELAQDVMFSLRWTFGEGNEPLNVQTQKVRSYLVSESEDTLKLLTKFVKYEMLPYMPAGHSWTEVGIRSYLSYNGDFAGIHALYGLCGWNRAIGSEVVLEDWFVIDEIPPGESCLFGDKALSYVLGHCYFLENGGFHRKVWIDGKVKMRYAVYRDTSSRMVMNGYTWDEEKLDCLYQCVMLERMAYGGQLWLVHKKDRQLLGGYERSKRYPFSRKYGVEATMSFWGTPIYNDLVNEENDYHGSNMYMNAEEPVLNVHKHMPAVAEKLDQIGKPDWIVE
jgi:hypothetical protein